MSGASQATEAKADLVVFDNLPKIVRDALQDTVRKWSSTSARDALNMGYPPSVLATMIKQMDWDQAKADNPYA